MPLLSKLFLFFLCAVSIYTLISLVRVLFRLRSLKKLASAESPTVGVRLTLATLQHRTTNLRHLLIFAFYLFGFCFFLQIPTAFIVLGDSKLSPLSFIFMQLATFFEYAADVFLLFLLLHTLQWFVSNRLQAFTRQQVIS
jgi:hypothetical protein